MSFKATLIGYGAPVCVMLLFSAMVTDAFAQAGGRPLILDTQTGIHSGAGGMVLQTAPLNQPGMVPARPLGTLPEVPQQGQQTIVVSPYIEVQPGGYSGAQDYGIAPRTQPQSGNAGAGRGLRSSGAHSGGLYGGSASVQPHTLSQTPPQSSQQLRTQPRAQPASPRASLSTATDPATVSKTLGSKPKTPSRPSDPHTATGTVTSLE
jgi:hypothetical protein